jgi:hypothetical protein
MPRGCGHATPHAQAPAQPGSPMIAARKPQHLPRLRQSPCSVRPFQPCHEQCLQPSLPNLQGDAIRGERGHPSENAKRVTTYAPNRPADERPTSFGAPFAFLLSRRVGRISEPNRPSQRLRQIQSSFPLRWVDEVSRTSSAHFFCAYGTPPPTPRTLPSACGLARRVRATSPALEKRSPASSARRDVCGS